MIFFILIACLLGNILILKEKIVVDQLVKEILSLNDPLRLILSIFPYISLLRALCKRIFCCCCCWDHSMKFVISFLFSFVSSFAHSLARSLDRSIDGSIGLSVGRSLLLKKKIHIRIEYREIRRVVERTRRIGTAKTKLVPLFVCCYVRWLLFSSLWSQKLSQVRVVGVTCAACVFPCLDKLKFPVCFTVIQHYLTLKELSHGLRRLKSLASIFQIRRLQSVLIFPILSHPCSFMVYHYVFAVFLSY